MNKLLIPTILVATIMIAGVFAFNPVEKASTVHTTIGTSSMLTTTMTLPQNGDDILLVIDCGPIGGTILDVFHDNSPTGNGEIDYDYRALGIDASTVNDRDSDRSYRNGLFDRTFSSNDNPAYRSLWDQLWQNNNEFHHFNGLVCPPGEFIIIEWDTENGNNDIIVDVFVQFVGDRTASLSTTPDGEEEE